MRRKNHSHLAYHLTCSVCGGKFVARRPHAMTCCARCRKAAERGTGRAFGSAIKGVDPVERLLPRNCPDAARVKKAIDELPDCLRQDPAYPHIGKSSGNAMADLIYGAIAYLDAIDGFTSDEMSEDALEINNWLAKWCGPARMKAGIKRLDRRKDIW